MNSTCICGEVEATTMGEKLGSEIGRCERCGTVRVLNVPADYERIYLDDLEYHGREEEIRAVGGSAHARMSYIDRFEHDVWVAGTRWAKHFMIFAMETGVERPKSVLDVGCANGAFLQVARHMGARSVAGVEVNPEMRTWAERKTGCRVLADICDVDFTSDAVTLHDVIEHARCPEEMLHLCRDRMNAGGVMVIDTPDAGDGSFERLGMYWHHCKPREHLWYFGEEQLRVLAGRCGLEAVLFDRPISGKLVGYFKKVSR